MEFDNFHEESQSLTNNYETERNKPTPSFNHGAIQHNIGLAIDLKYRRKFRIVSELSLNLNEWSSVPDLSLFAWKKLDPKNDQIKLTEAPLCTIEILSPTQSLTELIKKTQSYFDAGVKSCWVVLPDLENIYIFSSPDNYEMYRTGETLIDKNLNIQIEVSEVFE